MGPFLKEKLSFKMLRLSFSSKLDWGCYIISISETVSKKIGALVCSMKFLSAEVLCIYKFTIQPCIEYCCKIGCKCGYLGLLVLHLLSLS